MTAEELHSLDWYIEMARLQAVNPKFARTNDVVVGLVVVLLKLELI